MFLAKKFVVLSCHFRRQKDSEKSPVTIKVKLVVAFDGITSTAKHLRALRHLDNFDFFPELSNHFSILLEHRRGRWAILYPPKVCFSCSVRNRNVFLAFLTPYSYSSFNIRKKKVICSEDSVLIILFAKC